MNQEVHAPVDRAPVHPSAGKAQGDGRGMTHLGVFRALFLRHGWFLDAGYWFLDTGCLISHHGGAAYSGAARAILDYGEVGWNPVTTHNSNKSLCSPPLRLVPSFTKALPGFPLPIKWPLLG